MLQPLTIAIGVRNRFARPTLNRKGGRRYGLWLSLVVGVAAALLDYLLKDSVNVGAILVALAGPSRSSCGDAPDCVLSRASG
jgi:hypothetical protein